MWTDGGARAVSQFQSRRALGVLLVALGTAGCAHGGKSGGTAGETTAARTAASDGEQHDGSSPATAYRACAQSRSDYQFVADTRCRDGSRPLGGDRHAGGGARLGNVGQGPDGHI